MTILFFSRRFYPLIGGVEKHTLEIGKRLVEKGYKVIVVTENEKNTNGTNYHSLPSSATFKGIKIIRINAGKSNWLKKFRIWIGLFKHINTIRSADIIHCHDIFFWYLPFRFIFPLKKVFTTFHGYEGNNLPTKKAISMHKIAEKLSYGNICIGKFLEKWYGTKATFISYGGVDVPRQIKIKDIDKNLIVFLGRLEPETGIMTYLEAFKKITQKYPKMKLEIVGDGSFMQTASDYSKNNQLNIKFWGFIDQPSSILERASFMFVSRYLGILESMAIKKYVLSIYNNKIKRDYLQLTPFSHLISISSDSETLKDELFKYISNKDVKNKKINSAYIWVKDKTWDNLTNIYLNLWKI